MKCDACGQTLKLLENETYHYTESGLPNLYLENAQVLECGGCGARLPVLSRIDELHSEIARSLAFKPVALSGAELRFLRKHLGMNARSFAALLHVDPATLSRWETDSQPLGDRSDLLVRYVYFRVLEERTGQMERESVIERAVEIDMSDTAKPQQMILNAGNPDVCRYAVTC